MAIPRDHAAFPFRMQTVWQIKSGKLPSISTYLSAIYDPVTKRPTHLVVFYTDFHEFDPNPRSLK